MRDMIVLNVKKIRCPYEPRVYGVGYIGEGPYKSKENDIMTKQYSIWSKMLRRCYETFNTTNPSYEDCYVCEEWLNFQNFAYWYDNNYYEIDNERMEIDKDILYKGNKVYSPETCIIVTQRINSLFIKCNGIRGEYPIGVSKSINKKKYEAACQIDKGARKHLGSYNTPEEAFYAYKEYKEKYIKEVADEYKEVIPYTLYEAMYNYEVEITD